MRLIVADDDLDGLVSACVAASELASGGLSVRDYYLPDGLEELSIAGARVLDFDVPTNPPGQCRVRVPIGEDYYKGRRGLLALDLSSPREVKLEDAAFVDHHGLGGLGFLEVHTGGDTIRLVTRHPVYSTLHAIVEIFDVDMRLYEYPLTLAYYADYARKEGARSGDPVFLGYHVWRKEPGIKRMFLARCLRGTGEALEWLVKESRRLVEWAEHMRGECEKSNPVEYLTHRGLRGAFATYYDAEKAFGGYRCLTPCDLHMLLELENAEYDVLLRYTPDAGQGMIGGLLAVMSRGRWGPEYSGVVLSRVTGALEAAGASVGRRAAAAPDGSVRFGVRGPPSLGPAGVVRAALEGLRRALDELYTLSRAA